MQDGGRKIRLAAEGIDADAIAADRERGTRDAGPRRPKRDGGKGGPVETLSAEPDQTFGSSLGDALRAALDRDKKS